MKAIRKECIFCRKLLLKHMQQIMGPLSNQQLTVSPIFFYTFIDAWGPVKAYVPAYQRPTRSGNKLHDIYLVVFACAATGMVNVQAMEGGKNVGCVLDVLNRFFCEIAVPKICYIDQDSAMMKALSEGQVELISNDGVVARQRGIRFETCSSQGHNAHGRVEARIKMLQEAFQRSDMKGIKLHSLGWQSLGKVIEHEVNSIPLGFLQHQDDAAPLLRVLTPNLLKLNAAANRSPRDLFVLPSSGNDLMSNLEDAYKLFFRVWNESYVPLIAKRQKWHYESEDLTTNDIVYFKIRDSAIGSKWLIGKVEDVIRSKDDKVRRVIIGYKYDTEQGERSFRLVERPIRECVKLVNLEDTTLYEDIEMVRNASKKILGYCINWHPCHDNAVFRATYGCNSSSADGYLRYSSTDIGYEVATGAQGDIVADTSLDCTVEERDLGLMDKNDTIFDIETYDDKNLDDYNDKIYLL